MAYFHQNLKYHEDTKEKRNITKDDIEFLKELQKERNTQDHCGTANPRTWVIKDRDDKQANEDSYDYVVLYSTNDYQALDVDDIHTELMEYIEYNNDAEIENIQYDKENKTLTFDYDAYRSADIRIDKQNGAYKGIEVNSDALEFIQEYLYDEDVDICYMQVNWEHMYCFLTQKAAEEYLKRNEHHHSEDAHTYCISSWRNPQMDRLINILESVDWDKVTDLGVDMGE